MVKNCCVPTCTTVQGKLIGVTFHEFPCEQNLREKWINVVKRKDWLPSDRSVVCSLHFHERDYKDNSCYSRSRDGVVSQRKLKAEVVPSIFPRYPVYLQQEWTKGPTESNRCKSSYRCVMLSCDSKLGSAYSHEKCCVVTGCTNDFQKLFIWEREDCTKHVGKIRMFCTCPRPFRLFTFPEDKCDESKSCRLRWIANLKRKDYIPKPWSLVCSDHFREGKPTEKYPYPELKLGYNHKNKKSTAKPRSRKSITHLKLADSKLSFCPVKKDSALKVEFQDSNEDVGLNAISWTENQISDQPQQMNCKSCKRRRLTEDDEFDYEPGFHSSYYYETEGYESPVHLKLCLLCRKQAVQQTRTTAANYQLWAKSCAGSMGSLLNLGDSFHDVLLESCYCNSCLTLVRDIDLTLSNINVLQDRLSQSREKVVALLSNNARLAKQNEGLSPVQNLQMASEDIKPKTYDLKVLTIWETIQNQIQTSDSTGKSQVDRLHPGPEKPPSNMTERSSKSSTNIPRKPANRVDSPTPSTAASSSSDSSAPAKFLNTISSHQCTQALPNIVNMEIIVSPMPEPSSSPTPVNIPVQEQKVQGTRINFQKKMIHVDPTNQFDQGLFPGPGDIFQYPNLRLTSSEMEPSAELTKHPWI